MDISTLLEESLAALRQGTAEGERRAPSEFGATTASGVANNPLSQAQIQPRLAARLVPIRDASVATRQVVPMWGRVLHWRARMGRVGGASYVGG